MGDKRSRRKKRRRVRHGEAPPDAWRCHPTAIDADVAAEIARRHERRAEIDADDEEAQVEVRLGDSGEGLRSLCFADLKARWRREAAPKCPGCGGPRLVVAEVARPRILASVCGTCGVAFVEHERGGRWIFRRWDRPSRVPSATKPVALKPLRRQPAPPAVTPTIAYAVPQVPWCSRPPRRVGWPSSGQARAHWISYARHALSEAWRLREIDGLRDHLDSSCYATNITALRAPGRAGPTIAVLKRAWRAETTTPGCSQCREPWDPLREDAPRATPLVLVSFDVLGEDADGPITVAYWVCLRCFRTHTSRSPIALASLQSWAGTVAKRHRPRS